MFSLIISLSGLQHFLNICDDCTAEHNILLIAIKILVYLFALFFFFFWPSCSNHCFAALALGAGVEQPFGCLIVQNRQGMQSMGTGTDLGSSGP